MAYIRKFRTTSGATGVQVCYKDGGRVVKTVHVGSADNERELARLIREAKGIMNAGQATLFDLEAYDRKVAREKKAGRRSTVVRRGGVGN